MALLAALITMTTTSGDAAPWPPCGNLFGASTAVRHISELPANIKEDLIKRMPDISDSDGPLQETDTPEPGIMKSGPFHRFSFGIFVNNEWFVSLEHGAPYGIMTIGYVRTGNSSTYQLWPAHIFGGPPCNAIKAALNGVTTYRSDDFVRSGEAKSH